MTTPSEEYRLIPLTQNQSAIVDAADYDWLMQWNWRIHNDPKRRVSYAVRNSGRREGRARSVILMHREILGLKSGDKMQGDHINCNGLDNRRSNLRKATHAQNIFNQRVRRTSKSGYRGVSFHTASNAYVAKITAHGKLHILGYRKTAAEAHELYRAAAASLFGEFARTD